MAFAPDKITKQNILDAVKKIESQNIELEPSRKYDVIINGKSYPPKEVMRYAHEIMDGEKHFDEWFGGKSTNKYFIALGFEIKGKSDSAQTITGNIWKLGCNWGSGKPSFYNYIKEEEFIIGVEDKTYSVGDLILVTEGHQVNAIARINEVPKSVTSNGSLKKSFGKLEIEYESWVNYANAEWYELDEDDTFVYQLQQGICKVQNADIRKKAIDLWNSRNSNYWIFQANPNAFDVETALKNNLLESWTVTAHKDSIQVGDKVILWVTGKKSGCYALAEVTSQPQIELKSKDSHLWKSEDKNPLKAGIKITHNLVANPILTEEVKKHKALEKLKVGNQGTNFGATKKEYKQILSLIKPRSKMNYKEEYIKWMNEISPNDSNKTTSYVRAIEILSEITQSNIFESDDISKLESLYAELLREQRNKQGKYYYTEAPSYGDSGFYSASIKTYSSFLKDFLPKNKPMAKQNHSAALNCILFGPPGTGKTYNSIDKAVEIAAPDRFIADNHTANKIVFDELRKTGQIEFVTFHQNYSYEDFVVGISPDVKSGTLRFDRHEGIFKLLSDKAKQNWLAATNKKEITIDFNFVFNTFFSKLIEEEVKEVEIPMKSKGYKFKVTSIDIDEGRIKFTKQSGGTGHDLLVKNLQAIYEGKLDYGIQGLGVYYNPLVEHLKEFSEKLEPQKSADEELKNFVLVIDEINRANISKVFGELITLLEDDKRLGEENELKITLPNNEKEFGVPPNLYIIGTMNTADKSIALIDIALRRRFEFIGYYPKYDGYDFDASSLLQKINEAVFKEKKSSDYLIGHAYFMKNQPIKSVLQNKVVPLLMEYFSGKTDIVSKIFTETNWNVNYNTTNYSWDIAPK